MKPEDKELIVKDLSARLPYEPIVYWENCNYGDKIKNLVSIDIFGMVNDEFSVEECKPYLRPMSSMTEEEKKEYIEYAGYEIEESVNGRHYEYYLKDFCGTPDNPSVNTNGVDWLNKNMFDFRGLIPKDLALSTDEYNPYKN